jgi:hypothetical protein
MTGASLIAHLLGALKLARRDGTVRLLGVEARRVQQALTLLDGTVEEHPLVPTLLNWGSRRRPILPAYVLILRVERGAVAEIAADLVLDLFAAGAWRCRLPSL